MADTDVRSAANFDTREQGTHELQPQFQGTEPRIVYTVVIG